MKPKNKVKRLQKKQEAYETMVGKNYQLKSSMKKPGSMRKP